MRDDEADEADDAGDGDARCRDDCRQREQDPLGPFDLDTEALGVLLAQQHHVQVACVREQHHERDGHGTTRRSLRSTTRPRDGP